MFVLIVGGGRTGTELAQMLLGLNHEISIIENRPDFLARMHREIPTEAIYQGSAISCNVLENAGIRRAHVLAACSSSDPENLIVCYLARQRYDVPRTIARVNDPRNAWLFDQKFFVDVALNHSEVMAKLIEEEMSLGDMMTLLKLRRGEYSLVEEKIPHGATAIGTAIKDLNLPENCVIAAIIRHGKILTPHGDTTFEVNDEVLAITDRSGAEQLSTLLSPDW
ncbi:MAG: TrkA family potassium uptake protein [Anaerolineales bacterium]|nr:TrkA family potassium uptake protein [Anaerolineales bacterium]